MKRMWMLAVAASLTALTFAGSASADETAPPGQRARRGVVVVAVVKITARKVRVAAVDVARTRPELGLGELRRPASERLEGVTAGAPF